MKKEINRKQFNRKNFLFFVLIFQVILYPIVAKAQQGQIYHNRAIPIGAFTFYERALQKRVSYIRSGNEMIGAVYNSKQPDTFTCFHANIYQNGVEVLWWENLWQIGRSNQNSLLNFYTIADFTVDNSKPESGLENPFAVERCRKMFEENI